MKLNDQQAAALAELHDFKSRKKPNEMLSLKGYAGTGKTTLISLFVEQVMRTHPSWKIAMTAPTNKAVQVLRQSSQLKGVVYKTIHSLLGLVEDITESGAIEFTKDWNADHETGIEKYKILIIDEVSMLNDELFFQIRRSSAKVKIIFMGDPAQIPPVGKEDCEPFLNPEEHCITELQLTTIMRQGEGSAIVDASFCVRENLNQDGFKFDTSKDLLVMNMPSDRMVMAEKMVGLFSSPDVNVRVVAWTNRKVAEYNRYIRGIIFPDAKAKLVIGERLIMLKPFKTQLVAAERLYKIKPSGGLLDNDLVQLSSNQEITVIKLIPNQIELPHGTISIYSTVVEFIDKEGEKRKGIIPILHDSSEHKFETILASMKEDAIKSPMSERKAKWKEYYRIRRCVAEVDYAYAVTAHKSQGSTYGTCIVDMKNIRLNDNIIERNRILYTAMTRAKNELILIQ